MSGCQPGALHKEPGTSGTPLSPLSHLLSPQCSEGSTFCLKVSSWLPCPPDLFKAQNLPTLRSAGTGALMGGPLAADPVHKKPRFVVFAALPGARAPARPLSGDRPGVAGGLRWGGAVPGPCQCVRTAGEQTRRKRSKITSKAGRFECLLPLF